MQEEVQMIVEGTLKLQQNSSWMKDIIFPFFIALFSAFLGGWVAYLAFLHQDKLKIEKEKILESNKWVLSTQSALQSLMAIKENYHGKLTDNPLQRLFEIPIIPVQESPFESTLASLVFLSPKKDKGEKWRQLPRIGAMSSNYTHLLGLWDQRTELVKEAKAIIANHNPNSATSNLTINDLRKIVGVPKIATLIDLTESLIILTDDLIIEMNDFLAAFPSVAKASINRKILKKYGGLLSYSSIDNSMIERCQEVNYEQLAGLLEESIENVKNKFSSRFN